MKLLWATDIHLDSASTESRTQFVRGINQANADKVLFTGDIATGKTIISELKWLHQTIDAPLYFVLGNHDYYGSSIETVRSHVSQWTQRQENAYWLDESRYIKLSHTKFLIGDGGWGDARNGDFLNTPIRLNDHRTIKELTGLHRDVLQQRLQQLGCESQKRMKAQVTELLNGPDAESIEEIIVATHVPPFPESAWYMGYSGAVDWIPDFTCKSIGDLLLKLATQYRHIQWTVLCGHGHHAGTAHMRDNLVVYTGAAEYGSPTVEKILTVD